MKIELEILAIVAVFALLFVSLASFGINITAAQINWSSVTFSLGFIVGAILMIFYLKRRAFIRALKKIASRIRK